MTGNLQSRPTCPFLPIGAACFLMLFTLAGRSTAYIDAGGLSITLPEVCLEFRKIAVLKVEKINAEKGAVLFQVAETLQGTFANERDYLKAIAMGSAGNVAQRRIAGLLARLRAGCWSDCCLRRCSDAPLASRGKDGGTRRWT